MPLRHPTRLCGLSFCSCFKVRLNGAREEKGQLVLRRDFIAHSSLDETCPVPQGRTEKHQVRQEAGGRRQRGATPGWGFPWGDMGSAGYAAEQVEDEIVGVTSAGSGIWGCRALGLGMIESRRMVFSATAT